MRKMSKKEIICGRINILRMFKQRITGAIIEGLPKKHKATEREAYRCENLSIYGYKIEIGKTTLDCTLWFTMNEDYDRMAVEIRETEFRKLPAPSKFAAHSHIILKANAELQHDSSLAYMQTAIYIQSTVNLSLASRVKVAIDKFKNERRKNGKEK